MEQPPTDNPGEQPPDSPEERATSPPRIWVGSLADYNAGVLHGRWLDAARDPDELLDDITWMLVSSPTNPHAEEWGIFDYEGFGVLRLGEYENLDTVSRLARGVVEHGLAFTAWASDAGTDGEALARFPEAYLGHWPSVTAHAEHLLDDLGYQEMLDAALPEFVRLYARLDTEALARDLTLGGDITVVEAPDGGVWVFDAHG